jgi:hypothetical protein
LHDGAVRYIHDRGAMEVEVRHDHEAGARNAVKLINSHKPKKVHLFDASRPHSPAQSMPYQSAVAKLSGMTSEPKTDIARARQFEFGESIDPKKLSLHTTFQDFHRHAFEIRHGDEVVGSLSGFHDGKGRMNIQSVGLSQEKFGGRAALGALGPRGVRQLGRELRQHGYHTAWSPTRTTGLRSASQNRLVPDRTLPESVADALIKQQLNETAALIYAYPVAGGAYKVGKIDSTLTHACLIDVLGNPRPLCGRVKPEHILDDEVMRKDAHTATCKGCQRKMGAMR